MLRMISVIGKVKSKGKKIPFHLRSSGERFRKSVSYGDGGW